ncbi:hypothetical protein M9H77_18057 [Catharanthus roseus]|uniref:Uncharacterized protein n=1 Tax=Catharanthus roseus TaxID=4058 RepID=A0ACC0B6C5_CATRO|nr:hypothetical protein M9H77_18057 [Catharanthus roseus]
MHATSAAYCASIRHDHYQPNILRALDSITTVLSINIKSGYRSWGTYQLCLETNLSQKLSMSSEEALLRGTSHIKCNPLTLPNT